MTRELSIIFPIYNEEKTIKITLNEWVEELKKLKINFEIILAEDGSTDNTKTVLNSIIDNDNENIFINNIKKERRGYATALLESFEVCRGRYIFCSDADGQCSPRDFYKFLNLIKKDTFDIVIGHRYPRKDNIYRIVMSKMFFILHKILFFSKISDPSCPYIIFKKEILPNITGNIQQMTEGFWWGFIGSSIKNKLKISQIKISHKKRTIGTTNVFKLSKIPLIAYKNIVGLIRIKIF